MVKVDLQKDLFIREYELKKITESINKSEEQYWLFLLIVAGSGARLGEVCRIKLSDFCTEDYSEFTITNTKVMHHGKPARIEKKYLPTTVAIYLKRYIHERFHTGFFREGYLFPGNVMRNRSSEGHIKTSSVRTWWCRKRIELGGSFVDVIGRRRTGKKPNEYNPQYRISLYSLRRYFATQFYKNSKDLLLTARALGHMKTDVTARYISSAEFFKTAKDIINKNDPFLNPIFCAKGQKRLTEFDSFKYLKGYKQRN